jgi:hypothetical protein
LFRPLGAEWQEQKSRFVWPNGALLYFRYLDRDADADAYQGHDYTRVYVEELTQFPTPSPWTSSRRRSVARPACRLGFRATCNPGGPGHTWVKAKYIDPGRGRSFGRAFKNPFDGSEVERSRVFIPAKLSDNPALLGNDPGYVGNLYLSGSENLVKAWLEGDWNVIEGAFFDKWSGIRNVIRPVELPKEWIRFRSMDWGSARPFSVGWWAVAGDVLRVDNVTIPRGALVRYREWYGSNGKPNEGLKLTAEQVADGIKARETGDTIAYGVLDPAAFAEDGGPSIAERMRRQGVHFRPADNKRVPQAGAMGGWDQMRARILGDEVGPQLVVFSTCTDFIRTVPVLQHDQSRPEDLDTTGEDHAADEARYGCMSRPFTHKPATASRNPPDLWGRNNDDGDDWRA